MPEFSTRGGLHWSDRVSIIGNHTSAESVMTKNFSLLLALVPLALPPSLVPPPGGSEDRPELWSMLRPSGASHVQNASLLQYPFCMAQTIHGPIHAKLEFRLQGPRCGQMIMPGRAVRAFFNTKDFLI